MGMTKIEWADYTFNPWVGCQKVGPGCDNCYAEGWAKRSGQVKWGPKAERRRTSESNWKQPLKWNRKAEKEGRRLRVFCASLADVFDNAVPQVWRNNLWDVIRSTPNLDWLLVTKRIGNAAAMLPGDWESGLFEHAMMLSTVVNQEEADRDIPVLMSTPAARRGLSIEPLLGPIDLQYACFNGADSLQSLEGLDWVIVGGESGPRARPMNPAWARSLRDQCVAAGVPFFFKQAGEWVDEFHPAAQDKFKERTVSDAFVEVIEENGKPVDYSGVYMARAGKVAAGRLLDGREWSEYPEP